MYTLYALYNKKHAKIYIGQTMDLSKRMQEHSEKKFQNSFTSRYDGQWVIIYTEEVKNRTEALKREKQLKSFRGREFVRTHIPR